MVQEYVWLVTGANRGIGLEMVQQLLRTPCNVVVASCRSPAKATALHKLSEQAKGRLNLISLDVTSQESVDRAAEEVAGILGNRGIDYLVNNAGILPGGPDTAFAMEVAIMQETLMTNVVGSAYMSQAFVGLVEISAKKTIVNISSSFGSISIDAGVACVSYAVSKAGLNMLTYKQAKERPALTVISMCPGWLQTDMGGENALHPVSVGVEGVLKTVLALKLEDSGKFYNFQGEIVPW